jgi:hypothetical protein
MAKKNEPVEFEEGKELEEYAADPDLVSTLNSLEIPGESSPEATQRMETVAEPPIRNEKAKPLPPVVTQPIPKVVPQEFAKPSIPITTTQSISSVPVIEVSKIQPTNNFVLPPIVETTLPPPPPTIAEVPKQTVGFSFDSILEKGIQQKFAAIDEQGRVEKERVVQSVADKFMKFIEGATSDAPQVQQSIPVQPVAPVVVEKDTNKEALRLIDLQILDERTDPKTLNTLYNMRKQLSGEPVYQPDVADFDDVPVKVKAPVSPKLAKPQKEKGKNVTPKVMIAGIGLVGVSILAIVLLIQQFIH